MIRLDVWWWGLAEFGPAATITKSTVAWPVSRIARSMSAATSISARPGSSHWPIRTCTASIAATASASASTSVGVLHADQFRT
jgi:hypothetical protein